MTEHEQESERETLGDVLPGVTQDDLMDARATLSRFEATAVDEFGSRPDWLQTAMKAVCMAEEHYDTEIGSDGQTGRETSYVTSEKTRKAVIREAKASGGCKAWAGGHHARQRPDGRVEVYELTDVIDTELDQ